MLYCFLPASPLLSPPLSPPLHPFSSPQLTCVPHDLQPDAGTGSEEQPLPWQHGPAEKVEVEHQADEEEGEELKEKMRAELQAAVYNYVSTKWR